MRFNPAKIALTGASAVLLLISLTIAQDIGHLGVNSDPLPLVQIKRPQRRLLARGSGRGGGLGRPDPGSNDLRADVSEIGGATGKAPANSNPLPSVVANNTNVAPIKIDPVAPPTKVPAKPISSPFEDQLAKAEELMAKKDARAAVAAFRQALAIKPDAVDATLGLADALSDAKDYPAAEAEYQKVIAQNPALQNPTLIEARRGRADALYELKKYKEAVDEYQAAIKAGANDAGIYNNLANALYRTSTRENRLPAIENYRRAIEKQPDTPESADFYAGLANALRTQQQLREAQQAVERALQLAPNSSLAHSVAGRVYADLQDFNRASAEGKRAVELAPKDAFVYLNLGGIFYARDRYVEAITAYTAAQSYDRTWSVPRNSLGNVYLTKLNRPTEAAEEFEAAAKLEPRSSIIHNNLGAAYQRQAKFDQAEANYKLAMEFDSKNPSPLLNLAELKILQKKYDEAAKFAEQAVALEPNKGEFHRVLGDALKGAGHKKEAKAAYARAESLGVKVKDK